MKFKPLLTIQKRLLFTSLILTLALGCDTDKTSEIKTTAIEPSVKKIHVAYAGGGWRAQTGHAGWIISLLQDSTINLEEAFANVGTISSNSGGSWFSTMLAMSDTFKSEIQAKHAIDNWGKTGWLGKQRKLFQSTSRCDHFYDKWYAYTLCVLYENNPNITDWTSIVDNSIYRGYSLGKRGLNGSRNEWAQDKTLLIAASMLTSNVVLNDYGEDVLGYHDEPQYYQACHSPATPKLGSRDFAASCENDTARFHEVTPVTFSSLPEGSSDQIPSFLPSLKTGEMFAVGYSQTNIVGGHETAKTNISNPGNKLKTSVVNAAAASSAAIGFLSYTRGGPEGFLWNWDEAYEFRNLAPSFSLADSVQYTKAVGLTVHELADKKIVRIADGGPVDNSGVAQIVSYLQLNNQTDSFNIIAFDNVTSAFPPSKSPITTKAKVGIDIANLFGQGLCGHDKTEFCIDGCGILSELGGIGCVYVPELQIFKSDALMNTSKTWNASNGEIELVYTKYKVTTTENSYFGIKGGTSGTLHAFTCVAPNAGTVPKSKDFQGYEKMFQYINKGLNDPKNGNGLGHLKKAFGL